MEIWLKGFWRSIYDNWSILFLNASTSSSSSSLSPIPNLHIIPNMEIKKPKNDEQRGHRRWRWRWCDNRDLLVSCLFFMSLYDFHCFCYWQPVLTHGSQIGCRILFRISWIWWDLLCCQVHDQFWIKFHEVLRKRDGILCLCSLGICYVHEVYNVS